MFLTVLIVHVHEGLEEQAAGTMPVSVRWFLEAVKVRCRRFRNHVIVQALQVNIFISLIFTTVFLSHLRIGHRQEILFALSRFVSETSDEGGLFQKILNFGIVVFFIFI